MSFNSAEYALLLTGTFAAHLFLREGSARRRWLLLLASALFYASWNGWYLLLIAASAGIDWVCADRIDAAASRRARKGWMLASVVMNLGLLGWFKYWGFVARNLGLDAPDLLLPVGISFYTFQSMSYSLDVYLGRMKPVRSPRDFLVFVMFFPQLVAGPIVRSQEFLPQLAEKHSFRESDLGEGLYRILRGAAKKMILADALAALLVDPFFSDPSLYGGPQTLLALAALHFQIYLDFSGYTDIALGSARLFGFRLPENFDRPYAAPTPAAFWRRWHMTLTRYAFDYLYVPLGGSKGSAARTTFNIFLVFTLIGFWHGAEWTFVVFGAYHALGVTLSRFLPRTLEEPSQARPLAVMATNLWVMLSLPLFRAADVPAALEVYSRLATASAPFPSDTLPAIGALALAAFTHWMRPEWTMRLRARFVEAPRAAQTVTSAAVLGASAWAGSVLARSFVYFQF